MALSKTDIDDITETAGLMADAAGQAILPHFRGDPDTENKDVSGGYDPVTVADRASEKAMRAVLATRRPDDAILGEEFGHKPGHTGLTWVLDPIDGTRAFVSGAPVWGVLISVADASGPLFGMIVQPYIGERFLGGFGRAELIRGQDVRPLSTRASTLENAILLSTFPEIGTEAEYRAFSKVSQVCKLTRYGLDCYGYALVALGQADLVIEAGLHEYDIHAPIAVIEAAGGIMTDWQGGPAHGGGQVIAAGDAALHQAALELLNSA